MGEGKKGNEDGKYYALLTSFGNKDCPVVERWYRQNFRRERVAVPIEVTDEAFRGLKRVACSIILDEYGVTPYPSLKFRLNKAELAALRPAHISPPGDTINPNRIPEEITHSQNGETWTLTSRGRIHTLDQLLEAAKVDTDRWYVVSWKANTYEAQRSGGGIVQLWQVKAELRERAAWLWQPVEPREVYSPPPVREVKTTLIIPDSQNGYRWVEDMRRLEPLHDRLAWDLVCQVAERAQPDRIVLLGDMVDFAEGSKRWPITRDLMATTQPTIEELYWWLHRLRASCPDAICHYAEGNHEDRIDRSLNQLQPELSGLRAAGEEAPLLTWRRLLALDSLGIEYVGPYSEDSRITLHPDCEASHGMTVRSGGGSTVAAILKSAHVSQVIGHIHRREYASRTIHGPKGSRTIFACSPGTICRTDGIVPHAGGRLDWQQGFAMLTHVGETTHCELTPIDKGVCSWRGEILVGKDHGEEIAEATGWPQLR